MAKTKRKTSMCGCHRGLGKLSKFRRMPTGIFTAKSDSVDAIYDMMPSHSYGNMQAYDLWRTTPSGRQRLAQDVGHGDARRFATINEAALTRGRGVSGIGTGFFADVPDWMLLVGGIGVVALFANIIKK